MGRPLDQKKRLDGKSESSKAHKTSRPLFPLKHGISSIGALLIVQLNLIVKRDPHIISRFC